MLNISNMSLKVLNKIGVVGYTGKLGSQILRAADKNSVATTLLANSKRWIEEEKPQVIVNVSNAKSIPSVTDYCVKHQIPLVEGTSGLSEKDIDLLKKASIHIPVIRADNFSFGNFLQIQLLIRLTELLQSYSGNKELSIIDRHTTSKKDRPSATALLLEKVWQQRMQMPVADVSSVRGGMPVSDHTAWLSLTCEEVKIFHQVTDRSAPAQGTLIACEWVLDQQPSYYSMSDVYLSLQPAI